MKFRPVNIRGKRIMARFSLLTFSTLLMGLCVWPSLIAAIVLLIIGKYTAMGIMAGVYLVLKLCIKLATNHLKNFGQELMSSPDFIKVED